MLVKNAATWLRCRFETVIRLTFVLLVSAVSLTGQAQLANSAWPKMRANSLNTGVGTAGGLNGVMKWSFALGRVNFASASIGPDGTIYTGAFDGKLHAINPDGTQKWAYQTGNMIQSTPTVSVDGTVYVGSRDGNLYAISSSGSLKWSFYTSNYIDSAPALGANGTIYVGGMDNNVYAISPNGTLIWKYATQNGIWSSPAVGPDGTIYIGSLDSNLYALNPNGTKKWSYLTGGAIASSPAIGPDGSVYVGSYDYKLYAVNSSGGLKWSFPTYGEVVSSPAIGADGTLYVGSEDSYFYAVNGDGTSKWTFRTYNGIPSSPAIGSDGAIYFGSWDQNCYALNPDGSQRWAFATGNSIYSCPAIGADGTVYIASDDANLYAIGTGLNGVSVSGLSLNYIAVVSGETSTGTVTLASAAPVGGEQVSLTSSDPAAIVPANVTVAAGSKTATFTITTIGVKVATPCKITANAAASSVSVTLKVTPAIPTGVIVSPTSVVGGTTSTGTVYLNGIAPASGTVFTLTSNNLVVSLPATVTVAEGQNQANFTINTSAVLSQGTAIITATVGTVSETAPLTVLPPALSSVSVNPSSFAGGNSVTGTVTLTGPAATGTVVTLSSNTPGVTVPASVAVPVGQLSSTFAVKASVVTKQLSATLTATFQAQSQTTTVTVTPAGIGSIAVSPGSVTGGTQVLGTVTLTGPAPNGGLTIKLKSGNSKVTLPPTATISPGATTKTFIVKTSAVASQFSVVITGTYGTTFDTATLTLMPAKVSSIGLNPATVQGGASSKATVSMSGPAPAGGIKVSLTSSSSVANLPTFVLIGGGQTSGSVTVKTVAVPTETLASITGTYGGNSVSASLTVNAPVLVGLKLNPSKVKAGVGSSCTVTISSPAPANGLTITLQSSETSVDVPNSVTIKAGQTTATFSVKTTTKASKTTATISGTLNSVTKTAGLAIS